MSYGFFFCSIVFPENVFYKTQKKQKWMTIHTMNYYEHPAVLNQHRLVGTTII